MIQYSHHMKVIYVCDIRKWNDEDNNTFFSGYESVLFINFSLIIQAKSETTDVYFYMCKWGRTTF